MKKYLIFFLKIAFIIGCFYYVFTLVSIDELLKTMKSANPVYMFCAVITMHISQIISSLRMRYYYRQLNCYISPLEAFKVYYFSMFLSVYLPGGVTGDAYKGYYLAKHTDFPKLRVLQNVLSDRANGLYFLFIMLFIFSYFALNYNVTWYLLAFIGLSICYFASIKLLLNEKPQTALGALRYSIPVQFFNLSTVVLLLFSVDLFKDIAIYMVIFIISTIISIIPITIGGIGLREIAYIEVAHYFPIDMEKAVAASMLYFICNVFVSLVGAFCIKKERKKPKEVKK